MPCQAVRRTGNKKLAQSLEDGGSGGGGGGGCGGAGCGGGGD